MNNGLDGTLESNAVFRRILEQHPETRTQLDSVAVVTGCFDDFPALTAHLREVREAAREFADPKTFRVLEHNVATPEQFATVVGELGYEVFITLECFDQSMRKIALNGNVGRKGRNSREFIEMARTYANYLEAHPELGKKFVRVTYLAGIDSLETVESLFQEFARMNENFRHAKIIPWLSIFTPYAESMRRIQNQEFSLGFLFRVRNLARHYFGAAMAELESGTTAEGYARGLF